jgi:hypothetical protein
MERSEGRRVEVVKVCVCVCVWGGANTFSHCHQRAIEGKERQYARPMKNRGRRAMT